MLTLQFPMLLALLGTALMAVVIFTPSRTAMPVTTSFAPPAPPAFEPWQPFEGPDPWEQPVAVRTATWPALVDPHAAGCDVAARLGLVEALTAIRTPWAEVILRRALDDEPDSAVRTAAAAALEAVNKEVGLWAAVWAGG